MAMKCMLQNAKEEARELVSEAITKLFPSAFPPADIEIVLPRDPSHGDLSSPISFRLASIAKKSPVEIADKLAAEINSRKMPNFSTASSINGFLNFSFSEKFLHSSLKEPLSKKGKFGSGTTGKGKKVVVEYSSPNIGKPMHIGHIRSTILGDTVANILESNGYKVVRSNYLCEAGKQTAKLLLSLQLFGKEKIETEKDLLELYVRIHKEMETKPELDAKAQELVSLMELGDHATLKQLSKVRKLSTSPFHKNYSLLGVDFDEEVYDSDYVEDGRKIANEALEKGIAFMDKNGETVASLEKFSLPNLIIIRSNGTTLYSTRDLGLADRDFRKYKFDRRIYVTASEQNLHFQQVFAILKALGKPYASNLHHIGFGLISLEEGKLSTREGRVLLLEDVIKDAISLALEEVKLRQQYSEKDAAEIAEIVGIAALKYSVLRISSEKDIKFSLREAVKFDGNTAAYLQYTCVRAKNIMKKAK
ncbi:MAG: arginine--tRNA ligase, partial [Candidatus Micrarchaeota archaeon]